MSKTRSITILSTLFLVASCGGGGGGSGTVAPPVTTSGVGVGGTGIASVTGFGSVILNDDRTFNVDANTQLFIDDNPVSEAELQTQGTGLTASYIVADDVNSTISSGTLTELRAFNNVKGPVTSQNPLQVLGQAVVVTGDTLLNDVPGNDVANLVLGDIVEVSGYDSANNSIQAINLQYKASGTPVWKILGNVSALVAGGFQMGAQTVTLNGVVPRDCGGSVSVGDLVEVKAAQDPGFIAGDALDTVTDVECQIPGLTIPDGSGTTLKAEVEGIVTSLVSTSDFSVRGQRVVTTTATTYEGGAAEDILIGARLEAEGSLNTGTGVLTATKIHFRQTRVRIEAPVNVPGGGLGASFTMLDIITINTTALTEDDDGLVDGTGTAGNQQVEVRGFVDSTNQVYAEEVRERGNADLNDVRLRGPATDTCNPATVDQEFAILGVVIDTSDVGTLFFDSRSTPDIQLNDNAALCALIDIGTAVQAESGSFSTVPAARIDDADSIEIED